MANTTNLDLVKPAGTDKALVSVLNANSDKIDAFAGTTNQALSNKTYPVSSGTIVSANDDFNSFVTPGVYTVSSNAIAQSVGNCPIANAGRLCVWSPTSNALNNAWAVGEQMYYVPANNGVYKRRSVADGSGNITWGAWQQLALKSDYKDYTFSNLGFTADVVGTRGLQQQIDLSSDINTYGTPVAISIVSILDSGKCIFQAFLTGSSLYLNGYRASANSMSGNSVIVRVAFQKA